ncbi:hypothetical protein M0R88_17845 [Halorussus gelatinilyticus]|uniref:Uncharacterized protein n=1 Tax=Halorussus gelatinilyticus TaxID=2937524 RepID=A0A8U0IJX1_9EURY|nr:hypothetical protein [Halorussus gelatinilyticus]UPW00359.1 hypothetical protein M0R88_17845 [Halorussus gelatinilyticus]
MAGSTGTLDRVVEDERVNAMLGWALVAFLALVAAEEVTDGDLLWAGFAAFVAAVALVPAVADRDWTVMLPWEVLALSALPVLGRAMATLPETSRVATYLSVAALALVVAVELHVFTPVRMTYWFAVLFVVVATIATAGIWAVVQWLSDLYLGTAFLHSEHRLMWDFVAATVIGGIAGVVFEWYFRRVARIGARLPDEHGEKL